jgi:hypothetical protein
MTGIKITQQVRREPRSETEGIPAYQAKQKREAQQEAEEDQPKR